MSSSCAAKTSPPTRCPSISNSGPICRRPMSARSCAGSSATRKRPRLDGRDRRGGPPVTEAWDVTPADVLSFWRRAGADRWYARDDAFDAEIRVRFLDIWRKAAAGEFCAWEASDDGALALT